MRRRGRGAVGEALESLLGSLESAAKIRESLALAYWPGVVGPQMAAATEPESVRDGVLFVRTKSSVHSHELTFLKSHILERLNRRIGRPVIKEIIFRAQGVAKSAAVETPPELPTLEELALVQLPPQEQAMLRGELEELLTISDEKARRAVAQWIIRDRKLRQWRLERGWKVCLECNALHNTEADVCPICRVCR